jgi:hypothetical protein
MSSASNNQNQQRQLSQEEQEIFNDFELQQKKDSKYIKFEDGETKTLKFETTTKPEREESKKYAGKINWKFSVIEPSVSLGKKDWSTSAKVARAIVEELRKGYTVLDIERFGSGTDTRYKITPVS